MVNNANIRYWVESIEIALDEVGAFGLLTEEQINQISESISGAAENYGTLMGYDSIESPEKTEINKLIEQHKIEKNEWEIRENFYLKNISSIINVLDKPLSFK